MNLGLTRVLAVGQNIWPHDLFKQCLLNFSGKWGENICMLNVDPCFGSIYFQMLRRKRAKRPWSPWETRSADWLGVWVSCQIFNCQCRGDKIKISPGSERLLKSGPLIFLGDRQETNSFCSVGRGPGRSRTQTGRSESQRGRTRVWISKLEFASQLEFLWAKALLSGCN